ncbi:MAG: hypothetical protein RI936_17 [Pseudomonadota bacterium]|jgi:hypothetical protein
MTKTTRTTTATPRNVLPFRRAGLPTSAAPRANDNARQPDPDPRATDAVMADLRAALATLAGRGVRLPEGVSATFLDEVEQAVIEADARHNPRAFARRAQAVLAA